MRGAIPPSPQYTSWHGAQLKHRDNFTFTGCNMPPKKTQEIIPNVPVACHFLMVEFCETVYSLYWTLIHFNHQQTMRET